MPADTLTSAAPLLSLMQDAVLLHQAGRLTEARAIYEAVLRQQPRHFDAMHFLGVIAHQGGDHRAAVQLIDRAIGVFAGNASAYVNRALALAALGDTLGALANCTKAAALDPGIAAVGTQAVPPLFACTKALHDAGNLNAALAGYDAVLALKSDVAEAHFNRGNALKDLGRTEEAIAAFRRALALQPNNLEAKRNLFWLHFIQMKDPPLIERLSAEIASALAENDIVTLQTHKAITDFRVLHDLEQSAYLLEQGIESPELRAAHTCLQAIYARCKPNHSETTKLVSVSDAEIQVLARWRRAPVRTTPASVKYCLNPDNAWGQIEEQYFAATPEMVVIDNLLSGEALAALRKFCLIPTVWRNEYPNQYLGALAEAGFISKLHLQIAAELRQRLPRIFGPHLLEQIWAFKYTSKLGRGINVHADYARVNLNFWVTGDTSNHDPDAGGLVVYDTPAPLSWGFDEYNNNDSSSIYAFLKGSGAGQRRVPYRCNRAVLFNSRLFHETDVIDFADGYKNRRVNITYLFGRGLGRT